MKNFFLNSTVLYPQEVAGKNFASDVINYILLILNSVKVIMFVSTEIKISF